MGMVVRAEGMVVVGRGDRWCLCVCIVKQAMVAAVIAVLFAKMGFPSLFTCLLEHCRPFHPTVNGSFPVFGLSIACLSFRCAASARAIDPSHLSL